MINADNKFSEAKAPKEGLPVMVVMASGPEHDPRDDPAIGVMVVVVMMVTTHHDKLRHLDIPRRRRSGSPSRTASRRR